MNWMTWDTLQFLLSQLCQPRFVDVSATTGTYHSKPWWLFFLGPRLLFLFLIWLRRSSNVLEHRSTFSRYPFWVLCSLPFTLSMWVADLHHPKVLTRGHIWGDRLQIQDWIPQRLRQRISHPLPLYLLKGALAAFLKYWWPCQNIAIIL